MGKLPVILLLVVLGMAFTGMAVAPHIPEVHAYTNGVAHYESTAWNGAYICAGTSTCTIPSMTTAVGDLLLMKLTCTPYTVIVSTPTDATGDIFNPAAGQAYGLTIGTTPTFRDQTFYSSSAVGTSTGTISITLSATATGCLYQVEDVNTQAVGFLNSYSGTFNANSIGPSTTTTETGFSGTAPAGTYFAAFLTRASSTPLLNQGGSAVNAPLIAGSADGGVGYIQDFTGGTYQANSYTGTLTATDTSTIYDNNVAVSMILLAFSTSGSTSSCTAANAVQGTTNSQIKYSSGSTPLLGGKVYANIFNTGNAYVTMTSVQVDVKSISVSGTQQLTVGLYVSSSMPPTSASPAALAPMQEEVWQITTSATPQNFSFTPNFQTPPNYYVILTVAASTNGVTVYNSTTTGSPTSIDSSETFASGIPPGALKDMTLNKADLNLFGSYLIPCTQTITQSFTTTSVSYTGGGGSQNPSAVVSSYAYIGLTVITTFFLIGLKAGGIAGGMFGGILSIIICIMGGFFTGTLAATALVSVLIGCVALIYAGKSQAGGGGI